jgi:hypothetical protein
MADLTASSQDSVEQASAMDPASTMGDAVVHHNFAEQITTAPLSHKSGRSSESSAGAGAANVAAATSAIAAATPTAVLVRAVPKAQAALPGTAATHSMSDAGARQRMALENMRLQKWRDMLGNWSS